MGDIIGVEYDITSDSKFFRFYKNGLQVGEQYTFDEESCFAIENGILRPFFSVFKGAISIY